jgi:hypothetical protein
VLQDIVEYLPFGKIVYPADEEILLSFTDKRSADTLELSADLNNMIDLSVYTDLLGVLGDKPNGLIQTEIAGNFISNTGNFPKTNLTFHHFIRPYLRLARFDSKFRSLDSTHVKKTGKGDSVNRTYLNQIAYMQAGIKMNLFKWGVGTNQTLMINGGAEINLVNADSIYRQDLTYFNYYGEFSYTINRVKNFGMDAGLRMMWQRLSDGTREVEIVNRGFQKIFTTQATLYYYPTGAPTSRMYFRFAYFDNLDESKYNFSQFQVGYKTSLKLKK